MGRGPKLLEDISNDLFGRKASVVMTNVAGSPHTLYVAGVPIERVMFWVPHPGENLGMGISILSYAGGVQFGLITDRKLCPDPQAIIDRFEPEFEKLTWLTLKVPFLILKVVSLIHLHAAWLWLVKKLPFRRKGDDIALQRNLRHPTPELLRKE